MESGQVVAGKYRLNQLLGTGGMAEVWSATNTFTERHLAIKFMNAQVAKTPEAAARFLKEAKVSARVNHPNIIDIHDVGQTEEGQLFLVMELLTGFPLEVALRRQTPPLTLYELALIMTEVAQALSAAHASGIVHRDLKPTNIFLHKVREGVAIPKLLDFGVSKFLEDDQNHALTVAGTVLGSPLYMSPEQARGESQLDGRTDVFAFGAILFEALAGYRAYEAKNFNALIVKIATTKPKSVDECAGYAPESLRRVVRACLEADLSARAQTMDDVVAMLRAALPELECSPLRLPVPIVAPALVDPDATHALPVMRASDRPPPMPGGSSGSMPPPPPGALSGSIPPGAVPLASAHPSGSFGGPPASPTGPSWHTPNTSYASITVSAPRRSPAPWLIMGGAAVIACGLVAGVALALRSPEPAVNVATTVAQPAPPPAPVPVPAASSSEPASISVDALPGADKPSQPVPRGHGRLLVSAKPRWCTLSVDGKDRGPTPVADLDLPAGAHRLKCSPPHGKAKVARVTVKEGATARYTFTLDP